MSSFWDDPTRDFRQRYIVPEHFVWDPCDLKAIDYEGYTGVAFSLLPEAPCSILDVGCGDGWVAAQAVQRGYEVTGIDYSERAIKFARILVPKARFTVGDIRTLGQHNGWQEQFDAALHIEVLEHIPPEYSDEALKGIWNCLKQNAVLVLTIPSVNLPLNRWHYKHYTCEEGRALLQRTGFEVETIIYQYRLSFLTSPRLWRLLSNRYYDLRAVRCMLKRVLLNHYNLTNNPDRAGRYIFKARKL